jgi:hypothetical protein
MRRPSPPSGQTVAIVLLVLAGVLMIVAVLISLAPIE